MHLRDTVEHYLGAEEAEKFALWAFGPEFRNFKDQKLFMEAWNALHGKEYLLFPDGAPHEDIPEMISVWKASIPL